jgi:hypothetical protein
MRFIKASTQETYLVEGKIHSELIPEGTTAINIRYGPAGEVEHVFYNNIHSSKKNSKEMLRELTEMNSKELTQKEKENVVGLIKKLSYK